MQRNPGCYMPIRISEHRGILYSTKRCGYVLLHIQTERLLFGNKYIGIRNIMYKGVKIVYYIEFAKVWGNVSLSYSELHTMYIHV